MKIAILSNGNANYSTKRLVEVAKSRGHEVKVIKYKNAYASIEQNNPKLSYRGKELGHFDAIIPRIASNMTRYGTAMLRQMETQGMYTVSSSIAINRTRDKLRSMQLLAKAEGLGGHVVEFSDQIVGGRPGREVGPQVLQDPFDLVHRHAPILGVTYESLNSTKG